MTAAALILAGLAVMAWLALRWMASRPEPLEPLDESYKHIASQIRRGRVP